MQLVPPVCKPLAAAMAELVTASLGCQDVLTAVNGRASALAGCLNLAAAGRLVYPAGGRPARG